MTENERIAINGKEVTLYREVETNLYRFSKDAVDMLLEALGEREHYRAIGTIEEFKALKENQCKCEDCAGCTVWKCDCANVRTKAIDDFCEKMCEKATESSERCIFPGGIASDVVTLDCIADIVLEIAEELRGVE